MLYCLRCGNELNNEGSFCPQCGGASGATAQPDTNRIRVSVPITASISSRPDLLGLISLGAVLILLGLTWSRYPIDPSIISNYIQKMVDENVFMKPPLALLAPMIFFFYAVGAWGLVLSGLRLVFEKNVKKALGDLFGACFSFFSAFLLTNYANNVFTEKTVGASFIVAIGLLIVANAMASLAFREKKSHAPSI